MDMVVAALKGHPATLLGACCCVARLDATKCGQASLTVFSAAACGDCADLRMSKCSDIHCWCQVHLSDHCSAHEANVYVTCVKVIALHTHVHVLMCLTLIKLTKLSTCGSPTTRRLYCSKCLLTSCFNWRNWAQYSTHTTGSPLCVYAENRVIAHSMLTSTDQ